MEVVVTGAAGFIGQHVLRVLGGRSWDVTAIDRRSPAPVCGERWLTADLAVPDPTVTAALGRADTVVHLAGCPGVRDGAPGIARRRYRDNVLGGRRVLEDTGPGTQVVVASSSSVYGGAGDPRAPRAAHEDDPLDPQGGYARSKVALEVLARRRLERGGRTVIARPFTVAGPGQRPDMALARWIAAVDAGRPAVVLGDPARCRDITDVRQVAEALVRLAEGEATGPVNLGTGTPRTLAELVTAVGRALDRRPQIDHRPAHPDEVAATLADPRRCTQLTGLTLTTDLDEVVAAQATRALGVPAPA